MKNTVNKRDIAIIGISGKFPKSNNIEEFWKNLMDEKELSQFYSNDELLKFGIDEELFKNSDFIGVDSNIENGGVFDFSFFGYTPDEAMMMNPQTRMFHQYVWSAIEDSGYNIDECNKKIGIFAGANNDLNWSIYSHLNPSENVDPFLLTKLMNPNYMCSLVSYKLNLTGPCYFVDTACSTSLISTHMACRSLLMNECSIAISGGVKMFSTDHKGYLYNEGSIKSVDGHCRSFDANSTGIIGGEGVGVVVMKRLSKAIEDGDHIYAIIKGSAVNNDGSSKGGYTMPSVKGQVECIKMAHKISNVLPETITYVEAHGTGTPIGDPIEIEALNIAFNNSNEHKCGIGSVKTNMGHLDEAAGIVGLLKTILALHNKEIPASINFRTPNPLIDFEGGPFHVNKKSIKWENLLDTPLRAGVNSFGVGGTNVHMVLEEFIVVKNEDKYLGANIIRLSAVNKEVLSRYESKIITFLESNRDNLNFTDIAYTLQTGRKHLKYKSFVVCDNQNDAIEKFKNKLISRVITSSGKKAITFMFSGQGSQYCNMAEDFYLNLPFFKSIVDKGLEILKRDTNLDYKKILFKSVGEDFERINNTKYTQPLLFIVEYALAKQLIYLEINPNYMIGHSLGEYVAACISGVFSFEDGLKIITKRANFMSKAPKGTMLSIGASIKTVDEKILKDVSIAAINSPSSFVVSGCKKSINELERILTNLKIEKVKLKTSHAFHSDLMKGIVEEFQDVLNNIHFKIPKIPFVSNVTGNFILDNEAISSKYWVKQLLQTVFFEKGINSIAKIEDSIFLEIGPGSTLSTFVRQSINKEKLNYSTCSTISHVKDKKKDTYHLMNTFGVLWSNGIDINWELYYENIQTKKVSLPTNPFEESMFPRKVDAQTIIKQNGGLIPNKKRDIKDWFYIPGWKQSVLHENIKQIDPNCLLFSLKGEFSNLMKEKLINEGKVVVEIVEGDDFYIKDDFLIELNPKNENNYDLLVKYIEDKGFDINTIIYGWNIRNNEKKVFNNNIDLFEYNNDLKLLLRIVNSLNFINSKNNKKIVYLTTDEFNIGNSDNLSSKTSVVNNILNVLSQEQIHIFTSVLDFKSKELNKELIHHIYQDIIFNIYDRKVSYRGNKRWVETYNNLHLKIESGSKRISKKQNILITGGLGFVGYTLAKYFIENYDANLLLIGRKKISINNTLKTNRLNELKSYSTNIVYKNCNVSDYKNFKNIINEWEGAIGNVTGIIHAAGNTDITRYRTVEKYNKELFDDHFNSKALGLLNIYRILKNNSLDFVRIISSLSTILGGLTYGIYAASNGFMDTFILKNHESLEKWMVINFDGISESNEEYILGSQLSFIFEKSLQLNYPQLLISIKDLNKSIIDLDKVFSESENIIQYKVERPELSADYAIASTETQIKLSELWQDFFGIEKLGINDDFFELGGDSLKGMRILQKMEKEFCMIITIDEVFSERTIYNISRLIDDKSSNKDDNKNKKALII